MQQGMIGRIDDHGTVEVMFVGDKATPMSHIRVRYKSGGKRGTNIVSFVDIPSNTESGKLKTMIAAAGGALCEKHCEKYASLDDPDKAAKAALDAFEKLKAMIRGDAPKPFVEQG